MSLPRSEGSTTLWEVLDAAVMDAGALACDVVRLHGAKGVAEKPLFALFQSSLRRPSQDVCTSLSIDAMFPVLTFGLILPCPCSREAASWCGGTGREAAPWVSDIVCESPNKKTYTTGGG